MCSPGKMSIGVQHLCLYAFRKSRIDRQSGLCGYRHPVGHGWEPKWKGVVRHDHSVEIASVGLDRNSAPLMLR